MEAHQTKLISKNLHLANLNNKGSYNDKLPFPLTFMKKLAKDVETLSFEFHGQVDEEYVNAAKILILAPDCEIVSHKPM